MTSNIRQSVNKIESKLTKQFKTVLTNQTVIESEVKAWITQNDTRKIENHVNALQEDSKQMQEVMNATSSTCAQLKDLCDDNFKAILEQLGEVSNNYVSQNQNHAQNDAKLNEILNILQQQQVQIQHVLELQQQSTQAARASRPIVPQSAYRYHFYE